jgi:hypothetical protein
MTVTSHRTGREMTYFHDKAKAAFTAAGGNADLAAELADWAEQNVRNDSYLGVIVGEDGAILAETMHYPQVGATYVIGVEDYEHHAHVALNREVGLALNALLRATGKGAVHIRHWQVCRGASVPVPTERYCAGCRAYYMQPHNESDPHKHAEHFTVLATEVASGVRMRVLSGETAVVRTVIHRYTEPTRRWVGDVSPIPVGSTHVTFDLPYANSQLLIPGTYEIVRD